MLDIRYRMYKVVDDGIPNMIGNHLPNGAEEAIEDLIGLVNGDITGKSICHKDDIVVDMLHIFDKEGDFYNLRINKVGEDSFVEFEGKDVYDIIREIRNMFCDFHFLILEKY